MVVDTFFVQNSSGLCPMWFIAYGTKIVGAPNILKLFTTNQKLLLHKIAALQIKTTQKNICGHLMTFLQNSCKFAV